MEQKFEVETVKPRTGLIEVEQKRAMAEVQTAMLIAQDRPRDMVRVMDRIINACTRPQLAEQALYTYSRGGTEITGPSIRLAEAIAQAYGNIWHGIRELEQRDGESTVQAYAWDLETNNKQVREFQVKHLRSTKSGTYRLQDSRDIYEVTANAGARRLRAAILSVIPGDVVEAAKVQCEITLKTKLDITPERVASVVEKFAAYGVTKEMIEKRIQRRVDTMKPAQLISLGKIYNSLQDGMSTPGDWFEISIPESPEKSRVESLKDKLSSPPPANDPISSVPSPVITETPPENPGVPGVVKTLKCPYCVFETVSERGLKKHITMSHKGDKDRSSTEAGPSELVPTPDPEEEFNKTMTEAFPEGMYEDPRVKLREEILEYKEVLSPEYWNHVKRFYNGWENDSTPIESLTAMVGRLKQALDKQNAG